jgi:hypothetical protein
MDTLIAQLDQKYARYRKGLADGDFKNDVNFVYDCVFAYFNITENQSQVKEILEKSIVELEEKKKEPVEPRKNF